MDDDELIAALPGDDDAALRELSTGHATWLAACQRKAMPRDDVEDVLQKGFLAARREARTCALRDAPEAWLWPFARNQAMLPLRKRGPPTLPDAPGHAICAVIPETQAIGLPDRICVPVSPHRRADQSAPGTARRAMCLAHRDASRAGD